MVNIKNSSCCILFKSLLSTQQCWTVIIYATVLKIILFISAYFIIVTCLLFNIENIKEMTNSYSWPPSLPSFVPCIHCFSTTHVYQGNTQLPLNQCFQQHHVFLLSEKDKWWSLIIITIPYEGSYVCHTQQDPRPSFGCLLFTIWGEGGLSISEMSMGSNNYGDAEREEDRKNRQWTLPGKQPRRSCLDGLECLLVSGKLWENIFENSEIKAEKLTLSSR